MQEIHHFTSGQKLEWWGYGEWVEEPDEIKFEHAGFQCVVVRMAIQEGFRDTTHIFGGYLCGCVFIPIDHPFAVESPIDVNVHGGISLSKPFIEQDIWAIGFDCAHSMDIVPSMIKLIRGMYEQLKDANPETARIKTPGQEYRNVKYVIDETKSLAEQARAIYQEKK